MCGQEWIMSRYKLTMQSARKLVRAKIGTNKEIEWDEIYFVHYLEVDSKSVKIPFAAECVLP